MSYMVVPVGQEHHLRARCCATTVKNQPCPFRARFLVEVDGMNTAVCGHHNKTGPRPVPLAPTRCRALTVKGHQCKNRSSTVRSDQRVCRIHSTARGLCRFVVAPFQDTELDCRVCFEVLQDGRTRTFPCGHRICYGCFEGMRRNASSSPLRCPSCRARV